MRLPRDLSGEELARRLRSFGARVSRQTGSHIRLTTRHEGEHHVTIPNHPSLRIGTLSSVVHEIARHFGCSRDEVVRALSELAPE